MTIPTTRRYPRTLAEAFPDERACAIERPDPNRFDPAPVACVLAIIALAGMAFVGWL